MGGSWALTLTSAPRLHRFLRVWMNSRSFCQRHRAFTVFLLGRNTFLSFSVKVREVVSGQTKKNKKIKKVKETCRQRVSLNLKWRRDGGWQERLRGPCLCGALAFNKNVASLRHSFVSTCASLCLRTYSLSPLVFIH